jgi:hypothetical protein
MKKKEIAVSNSKIAIVFFVFLVFVVGVSLIFKFINLLGNGKFDDSRSFAMGMTNGKDVQVTALSHDLKSIVIFKLAGVKPEEAAQLLEVPIDGFVSSNSLDLNQEVSSILLKSIFNYNKLKTNMTIIDLARIAIFVKTIPAASIDEIKIKDVGKLALDKIVNHYIGDASIEKDSQTIQIINATQVSGLGNRLARLITNMGGNVIIVATENDTVKRSVISYIDKKSYTVKRLQKVLGYDVIKGTGNAMSDITITIGEDKVNSNPF